MRTTTPLDYDAIAHLYDAQPDREKAVDPELSSFLEQRGCGAILDIACGTGSQLVANRAVVAGAQLVGLDRSRGMLREVLRVLRCKGRFVMRNLCPQEHPDWLYYEYFPEARTIDLADFWPPERIVAVMAEAGFAAIALEPEHLRFEQDLRAWLDRVRRRDLNSQLMAIPDRAYVRGIRRLQREVRAGQGPQVRADHLCLITIRGDNGI